MNRFGSMTRVGALLAAGLAAGCSSDGGGGVPYGNPLPQAATLMLAASATVGNHLVDGSGRTLYFFAKDLPAGGGQAAVSACTGSAADTGSCVHKWPIFHLDEVVAPGLNQADVGDFVRADGVKQTTYKGLPLYYFFGDAAAGDIKGDGSTGGGQRPVFFVLRDPAYTMLTLTSATGATRLTDGAGRSLYYFDHDTAGEPPTSACSGSAERNTCLGNWPRFLAPTAVVPTGIDPAKFAVFTRGDQLQQSAFHGHPLYYFADDSAPGDEKGIPFGQGHWFTVDPSAL